MSTSPRSASVTPAGEAERVFRASLRLLEDPAATREQLAAVLADDCLFLEHPNLIHPTGTRRDKQQMLDGFEAGRKLMASQSYTVRTLLASGDTVAAQVTWRGTVGMDAGPMRAGDELVAHAAMFVRVKDGRIVRQENHDCFEPLPAR